MTVEQLQELMRVSVVSFSYRKVDGSVREAVGTLMPDAIESFIGPSTGGKSREPNPDVVCYFDIGAQAFRSFKKANFLEVLDD